MMRRFLCMVVSALCALFASARTMDAQSPTIDPDALYARLASLISADNRPPHTGQQAAAAFADRVLAEVQKLGGTPYGDRGKFDQIVPTTLVQIGDGMRLNARYDFALGTDFLPIYGHGLGVPPNFGVEPFMYGGRLGTASAVDPLRVFGKLLVMLPPLRANGQPEYRVWAMRHLLAPYARSTVALVSLELMPPSALAEFLRPQILVKGPPPHPAMPPVLAISRATAAMFLGRNAEAFQLDTVGSSGQAQLRFDFDHRDPRAVSRNVAVLIRGADASLQKEVVLVTAPLDRAPRMAHTDLPDAWPLRVDSVSADADAFTAAVALLEIGAMLAASPPARSVLLLWATGSEYNGFGTQYFLDKAGDLRRATVGAVTVDRVGFGIAGDVKTSCSPDGEALAGAAIPHLNASGVPLTRRSTLAGIDRVAYAAATHSMLAMIQELSNAPARPAADPADRCGRMTSDHGR